MAPFSQELKPPRFPGRFSTFGSGIRYSSDLGRGNSFNEQLTVAHDDQSLFLRSLGMAVMGSHEQALTNEGGAELYWSMLIRPIQ